MRWICVLGLAASISWGVESNEGFSVRVQRGDYAGIGVLRVFDRSGEKRTYLDLSSSGGVRSVRVLMTKEDIFAVEKWGGRLSGAQDVLVAGPHFESEAYANGFLKHLILVLDGEREPHAIAHASFVYHYLDPGHAESERLEAFPLLSQLLEPFPPEFAPSARGTSFGLKWEQAISPVVRVGTWMYQADNGNQEYWSVVVPTGAVLQWIAGSARDLPFHLVRNTSLVFLPQTSDNHRAAEVFVGHIATLAAEIPIPQPVREWEEAVGLLKERFSQFSKTELLSFREGVGRWEMFSMSEPISAHVDSKRILSNLLEEIAETKDQAMASLLTKKALPYTTTAQQRLDLLLASVKNLRTTDPDVEWEQTPSFLAMNPSIDQLKTFLHEVCLDGRTRFSVFQRVLAQRTVSPAEFLELLGKVTELTDEDGEEKDDFLSAYSNFFYNLNPPPTFNQTKALVKHTRSIDADADLRVVAIERTVQTPKEYIQLLGNWGHLQTSDHQTIIERVVKKTHEHLSKLNPTGKQLLAAFKAGVWTHSAFNDFFNLHGRFLSARDCLDVVSLVDARRSDDWPPTQLMADLMNTVDRFIQMGPSVDEVNELLASPAIPILLAQNAGLRLAIFGSVRLKKPSELGRLKFFRKTLIDSIEFRRVKLSLEKKRVFPMVDRKTCAALLKLAGLEE